MTRRTKRTAVLATALVAAPVTTAIAANGATPPPRIEPTLAPAIASGTTIADGVRHAAAASEHLKLAKDHLVLARRWARAQGYHLGDGHRARVHGWSRDRLRRSNRSLRDRLAQTAGSGSSSAGASTASAPLQAIAACESGGDPHAIGGGGTFRGKYQFTYSTWASVGGSGDPAAAPEAEQDKRAAMLYAQSGPGQWPVCGR